jgi:two-component system chemotaxis response regulator CheY
VVDDALFMRAMLKKLLTEAGFDIAGEAENGRVAVDLYQELKPDVVMMDITMPEMDGLTALKEIVKLDPAAKVVMCTALGQERSVMEAMNAGAKDYILKPFNAEKVVEVLKNASG